MKKACGNCACCVRPTEDRDDTRCGIDGHYIGYVEYFDDRCLRWTRTENREEEDHAD